MNDKPMALNPWIPERDASRLAVLGKLAEETGELGAIVCRCIIQGIDECEPVTKKPNRQALVEEIADVLALISINRDIFGIDEDEFAPRVAKKRAHIQNWLSLISCR